MAKLSPTEKYKKLMAIDTPVSSYDPSNMFGPQTEQQAIDSYAPMSEPAIQYDPSMMMGPQTEQQAIDAYTPMREPIASPEQLSALTGGQQEGQRFGLNDLYAQEVDQKMPEAESDAVAAYLRKRRSELDSRKPDSYLMDKIGALGIGLGRAFGGGQDALGGFSTDLNRIRQQEIADKKGAALEEKEYGKELLGYQKDRAKEAFERWKIPYVERAKAQMNLDLAYINNASRETINKYTNDVKQWDTILQESGRNERFKSGTQYMPNQMQIKEGEWQNRKDVANINAEGKIRAKAEKPPTADERKTAIFASRMVQGNDELENLYKSGYDPTTAKSSAQRNLPGILEGFKSSESKREEQAKRNFITGVLRYDSGAAINADEWAMGYRKYFPVYGDGPAELEQKRRNRINDIQAMRLSAGPAEKNIVTQPIPAASGKTSGGGSIQDLARKELERRKAMKK